MQDSIKSRIGEINHGYTIVAQYLNKVVLAISDNRSIAEMAVVWFLDDDGDTYSGSYFCNFASAQKEFFARACGGIYK